MNWIDPFGLRGLRGRSRSRGGDPLAHNSPARRGPALRNRNEEQRWRDRLKQEFLNRHIPRPPQTPTLKPNGPFVDPETLDWALRELSDFRTLDKLTFEDLFPEPTSSQCYI